MRTALTAIGLVLLIGPGATAQIESPAVTAILDSSRETPIEQVLALLTLIDLGEEDVAVVLWKSLGQADFEDAVCAELAAELGTARLMKLARREAAFAGARNFVDRCLNAAAAQAHDPQRLAKLIADLNDPTAAVRRAARVDLSALGTVGAAACLEALAQTEEELKRANLMFGLTSLHPEINPLLLAALADGRGHFRRDAAELAGYLDVREATPWLAAMVSGDEADPAAISAAVAALSKLDLPIPTARETRTLLMEEIEKIEAGAAIQNIKAEWPTGGSGKVTWWSWLQESGKFESSEYDPTMFSTLAAERFARMLVSCGEPTPRERQLALIYHFETREILSKATSSQMEEEYSTQEISATLTVALDHNQSRAAIFCAQILGSRGDAAALVSTRSRPSPLAAAVGQADRELRYAALEAIMKLSPQKTFAGASHVPKALWEFAAGTGAPHAVAASSVAIRGSHWAAHLREIGFDATPTTSGSQAIALAIASPRLSFILIDSDIGRPLLREVVFQLRSHPRTGRIPIAVLSSSHHLDRSRRIAAEDDWLIAVPRPHSAEAMKSLVGRLKEFDRSQESLEHRAEQAVQALTWIGQLLENGHPYDELHRGAAVLQETVYVPELFEPTLRALAVVGTAESQQTLLNLASQNSQPIELRRNAAGAFATSVQRVGRQLTTAQIHRQYDRYNASGTADEATQQVLGQVLDALEKKTPPAPSPGIATPGLNP
ncbi:MAG: hypothetical protein GXP28_00760 [Planctomycetes bacterium]|nr:hypothetical protein [Planctomycetota bacterium]